jgi:uncharacterized OB-fold protein
MTKVRPSSGTRVLPRLTDANRAFWTGGANGDLLVTRCEKCHRWELPPSQECTGCGGPTRPEPVSGTAKVYTWTLNHQKFHPDVEPPNLIALVVLDEQEDLRLATNLVDIDAEDVKSGLPVSVEFEDYGDLFYPVFAPVEPK